MRKRFVIAAIFSLILIISLSLCSCSLGGTNMLGGLNNNDQSTANAQMDKVLEAIKNKDKDALKSMFSKKAVAESGNIDNSIDQLFDFFQGNFVSYNDWNAVYTEDTINNGDRQKILESTYDVKTSKATYRFAIEEYAQDTADSDNVGVCSIYIINMEDDTNPQFAYWGDGKWTPGINFNKKNVLQSEVS